MYITKRKTKQMQIQRQDFTSVAQAKKKGEFSSTKQKDFIKEVQVLGMDRRKSDNCKECNQLKE